MHTTERNDLDYSRPCSTPTRVPLETLCREIEISVCGYIFSPLPLRHIFESSMLFLFFLLLLHVSAGEMTDEYLWRRTLYMFTLCPEVRSCAFLVL